MKIGLKTLGVVLSQLFCHSAAYAEVAAGVLSPPCQDINGDGVSDVSDAILFLSWRFQGSPAPTCPARRGEPTGLPDTGMRKCFDPDGMEIPCDNATCPGQDGRYATGVTSGNRFVDNRDGTVADTQTGLLWQKDTADVNGDGELSDGDVMSWCDALRYCEDLGLAGKNDWRLPNVSELLSIVDYGRMDQSVDPVFGALTSPEPWPYWSSTTTAEFPYRAWVVRYAIAYDVGGTEKAGNQYVRAVRGGVIR